MKIFLNNLKLVLASASPRRRELLGNIGAQVRIAPSILHVDESYPADLPAIEVPEFISGIKADAYMRCIRLDETLVTADTVVISDGIVLGKPASETEACTMLRMLSGRTHIVTTGVTLLNHRMRMSFSETTEVDFAHLTDNEIQYYVEHYRPFDKAGAYGIQEWIGYIGITGIRGDYYNVMGLPLHKLYAHLKMMF